MGNSVEFGGNKLALWYGKKLAKISKKYINKGTKTVVSNPTCKLINPFTLMLTFTVNNTDKYQLVLQGDYKDKYKDFKDEDNPIGGDEMFMIITSRQNDWFLKNS